MKNEIYFGAGISNIPSERVTTSPVTVEPIKKNTVLPHPSISGRSLTLSGNQCAPRWQTEYPGHC